jgi:hypothetical protein
MTIARGMSAPKRAVVAIKDIGRSAIDRKAIAGPVNDTRSLISVEEAERQAIQHEHRWVEAAAAASMRIPRG